MSKHKHEHKHKRKHLHDQFTENSESQNSSPGSLKNSPKSSESSSKQSNSSEIPLAKSSIQNLTSDEHPKIQNSILQEKISVCKIPVILGEKKFELFLESSVQFDDLVVSINNVKRIVYLTKDTIIPIVNDITSSKETATTAKVFLKGFLRSNFEYSIFSSINNNCIKADIKQLFIDTPFECTTKVAFTIPPIYNKTAAYTSFNSEPINCELKNSEIFSVNTFCDKSLINKSFPYLYTFKNIKEKLILTLTLKLIQEQNVNIHC